METPKEIFKKSTVHTLNINEGSPLQDAVISAMKEYAECKTAQLKADKEELLHFIKFFMQSVEDEDFIMVNNTDEDIVDNLLSKFTSLIQKMKP